MKIEIWSDFVCPSCYIAKRRLEKALQLFPYREGVTIQYRSYLVDPTAEYRPGVHFYDVFPEWKGLSSEEMEATIRQITLEAKAEGLDYRFDTMRYTNTFDAHRLFQFAEKKGKGEEMTERLLQGYFIKSELLSDIDTLIGMAKEIGLDEQEAHDVLSSNKFSLRVNEDIATADQIGIQDVPVFVFNETYAVSEVHSTEVFLKIIEKIWEEEGHHPAAKVNKAKTLYCEGDECCD